MVKKNTLRCKTLINAETVGGKKRQTHSSNLPHSYGHAHKHARTHEEYQTQTHTLDALLITANRTQINSIQHSTGCIVHKSMLIGWAMEPKTLEARRRRLVIGRGLAFRSRLRVLTDLAGLARPLGWAEALEAVFHVNTGATLGTGAGSALIHICG